MTYELWDKQMPIYDVTAEQAMINNPKYSTENSYVFYNDDGSIYDLLALSMIPNSDNLTDVNEICLAYIDKLTTPSPSPSPIDQADEIAQLKIQITDLQSKIDLLLDLDNIHNI